MFGFGKKQSIVTEKPRILPRICNFCGSEKLFVTGSTIVTFYIETLNTRQEINTDSLAFCGDCGKVSFRPQRKTDSNNELPRRES